MAAAGRGTSGSEGTGSGSAARAEGPRPIQAQPVELGAEPDGLGVGRLLRALLDDRLAVLLHGLGRLEHDAVAEFAPGGGHGWLAGAAELHVRMVEAWLTGRQLPAAPSGPRNGVRGASPSSRRSGWAVARWRNTRWRRMRC